MTSVSTTTTDRGGGLAEYAVLLLLITMACIAVLTTLGATVDDLLTQAAAIF